MKLFELFKYKNYFLFENTNNKKILVVYGGRFQPPTPGHYEVYRWLINHFGENNVFITTSNKVDKLPVKKQISKKELKSFFNFEEKRYLWNKLFGVNKNKIILSRNPVFNPEEILSKFDPENTIFVTVTSKKDEERFTNLTIKSENISVEPYPMINNKPIKFEKIKDKLKGYNEKIYYIILPEFKGISATKVRNIFQNDNLSDSEKKKILNNIYEGKMNDDVFDFINKKLNMNFN